MGRCRTLAACVVVITISLMSVGCSALFPREPAALGLTARENESRRAGLEAVGVVSYLQLPETVYRTPAKGFAGGAVRGAIAGAVIPIVVGAVAPVPLGTLVGVLVAPFGAGIGAVWGGLAADPAEQIEASEAAIDNALTRISTMNFRDGVADDIIRVGTEQTSTTFSMAGVVEFDRDGDDPAYDPSDFPGLDAVLEFRGDRFGLDGFWTIDPPSALFIEVRARLIRLSDATVLYDDVVVCRTDRRSYGVWAADDGREFEQELLDCRIRLAEKIIDDIFLLYPLDALPSGVTS